MRKATSFLLRFIGVSERTDSADWWTYFGSFGDDVFGDEDTAHGQARWMGRPCGTEAFVAETTLSVDLQTGQV